MSWDVSRRVFLKSLGLAAVGVGFSPSPLLVRAAQSARSGSKVLVHVFLRGGADPLNMVVPYGEPRYYEARGGIAIPPPGQHRGAVALDSHFGLHPGLAPLEPLYKEGRLAFVYGMGNYDVSRSHFSAQDFVEMGTPGVSTTSTGSLSRASADLPGKGVAKAVAFGTQRPISFLGPDPVLVVLEIDRFDLFAGHWKPEATRHVKAMYKGTALGPVATDIFEAIDVLQTAPQFQAPPANGAAYPAGPLGSSLRQAAQIVKAGIGTRCIFVNGIGNFDTHSGQLPANEVDYAVVGKGLAAFDHDLGRKMDEVVVLVTTEFGRTVFVNGSQGTDHGSGYCGMVLGGSVKGGTIKGRWPGLEKGQLYEERDLAVTTDFRDVFAELVVRHLGVSGTADLFPAYTPGPALGLL